MNSKTIPIILLTGILMLSLISVASASADKVPAFVCPVVNENVGAHNPNAASPQAGTWVILPPGRAGNPGTSPVMVPAHATNRVNGNAGTPGGPHASPGDMGYTAIWVSP